MRAGPLSCKPRSLNQSTRRMPLIERYLWREFVSTYSAVVVILMLISVGGLFSDLLSEITLGKVPASLLLSQLGLRTIQWLPMLLPLALFIGLLLAIGRLYADSEMAVLFSVGIGPQELIKPMWRLTWPTALLILCCATWWGPWAADKAKSMIVAANKSFLIAGLEAGRFVELPGRSGVLYVGDIAKDGNAFSRMFAFSERDNRFDLVTAKSGKLVLEGETQRILNLEEGYRFEGSHSDIAYRMMHFKGNEIRVPDREQVIDKSMKIRNTISLVNDPDPHAGAELHWRMAMPLFTIMLSLIALPLARSEPRQARYGRLIVAMLIYTIGMSLIVSGTSFLNEGKLPAWLGLWWLHIPLFGLASWLFWQDGKFAVTKAKA
jgi:lipopolysaccharide export system permease protein